MTRSEKGPEAGSLIAEQLKALGVSGILLTAAEQGEILEFACSVENCYCPHGTGYFDPIPEPVSDWVPTQDHIVLKSQGGQLTIGNVRLAHRLCNRVSYTGEPGKKDRERIEAARLSGLIGPRFRLVKDDVEIDTATSYEHALERAGEHQGVTILDTSTGAVITIPKETSTPK